MKAGIELTLYLGKYGERPETVALVLPEDLLRELREPIELSDDPFSLILASPSFFGGHGDAITIRRKKFALRREVAKTVALAISDALMERFGAKDKTDGYTKEQLP